MALNTAKKGSGLFAGLDNLSNEEMPSAAVNSANLKADKPATPEQKQGRGDAAAKAIPAESIAADAAEDLNRQRAPGQPTSITQPDATRAIQPSSDPSAPADTWGSDARQNVYNQPGFYQQAQYPPMSMTPPPMYTIDKRYKRKPKSFRTCIALTEELHVEIEAAKRSKRITSLNDLIYSLLCDYFNLEP